MNKIETGVYTRISKRTAKKMYNSGKSVYIVPCKVYPSDNGHWIKPWEINKNFKNYSELMYISFDSRILNYEYYNCNCELGYCTAFYEKLEG